MVARAVEAGFVQVVRIINQSFHTVLVLVAIVASLLSGTWLQRVPREHLLETATPWHPSRSQPSLRD